MTNYFTPTIGARETISVSTTSASATIGAGEGSTLVLYNSGANAAYVRWGSGAQTAVTTDTIIAPGSYIAVGAASNVSATVIAARTASSTTTLEVMPGNGDFVGFGLGSSGSISAVVTGAVTVEGAYSDDDTAANPACVGALCRTTDMSAATNNNNVTFIADALRKHVVLPYALSSTTWSVSSAADITDTSSTELKAAVASTRHYITSISVSNTDASVNTVVNILSAATVLCQGAAAANCGGFTLSFPVPLRGGSNEALNAQCVTTSAQVRVTLVGFSATI